MNIEVITTSDGSHSLINNELNETYHSTHGAIRESLHVFIKNGLQFWLDKNRAREVSILEIGFGTGLNAILALQESFRQKIKIQYTTLEVFPVAIDLINQLNYPQQLDFESSAKYFHDLHSVEWNKPVAMSPNFILEKINQKIQDTYLQDETCDVVFFDAFAPNKQPEMWELPVLEKTVRSLKSNGIFVTYCAQGQLKRNLKSLNLRVESLPGPPGKREMVRASIGMASPTG